jgi:hypothetical protein
MIFSIKNKHTQRSKAKNHNTLGAVLVGAQPIGEEPKVEIVPINR